MFNELWREHDNPFSILPSAEVTAELLLELHVRAVAVKYFYLRYRKVHAEQ